MQIPFFIINSITFQFNNNDQKGTDSEVVPGGDVVTDNGLDGALEGTKSPPLNEPNPTSLPGSDKDVISTPIPTVKPLPGSIAVFIPTPTPVPIPYDEDGRQLYEGKIGGRIIDPGLLEKPDKDMYKFSDINMLEYAYD